MQRDHQPDDEIHPEGGAVARRLPPKDSLYRRAAAATGQSCALCERPIRHPEVEYTVEWQTADERKRCRLHLVCYHLWFDSE
jgi:hypothetical protein